MTPAQSQTEQPRGYSLWFVAVVAFFVTSLITANVMAVKLVSLFGLALDAGTFIFPVTYIFGDVLTQWLAKSTYEAAATPLTYLVVNHLKRAENLDVYDRDTRFNPLLVRG